MTNEEIPARLSDEGRTATWNPALSRDTRVRLEVETSTGEVVHRSTMNSGRAKVREPERILRILSSS